MKKTIPAALAALSLAACSSTGNSQLLENLQGCQRMYQGSLGGLPGTNKVNVTINCDPARPTEAAQ